MSTIETNAMKFSNNRFVLPASLICFLLLIICRTPQALADPAEIFLASDETPAMEFFIAKGAPNSCGNGCDTWIAAEGRIDAGAANRFHRILETIGGAPLPIFFSSSGGELYPALELGRLLRARAMRAGVAITLPEDCIAKKDIAACSALIRLNPNGGATLWTENARCASACAFAILGASRREIAPGAYLGVHSPSVSTREDRKSQEEQLDRINRSLLRVNNEVSIYLSEMGIGWRLYEIVRETRFETEHLLSRGELYDLGIDRRDRIESNWTISPLEFSANGEAALKNITFKIAAPTTQFERYGFAISCDYRPKGTYVFSALRYFPDTTLSVPVDIEIEDGGGAVHLSARDSTVTPYRTNSVEVRQAKLSKETIEEALNEPTIDIVERPASAEAMRQAGRDKTTFTNRLSISTVGAKDAFKTIASSCPISRAP